jgi:hydroxypyruvate reductase
MDPRSDLQRIARASLQAVDPRAIVARSLSTNREVLLIHGLDSCREIELSRFARIFVIGFGKAAGRMAQAVEEVPGPRINKGLIVVKPGHELPLKFIRQVHGGHPVPDENTVRAAGMLAALADEADERTLVIVLISGGGSLLIAAPVVEGQGSLTLVDIQETTRQLLACGATIEEINCLRKHLLLLAGGRLAGRVAPATSISLVLSDVVGDDLQTIASGAMCDDSTTYDQALDCQSLRIGPRLPGLVTKLLAEGAAGKIAETPKPGAPEISAAFSALVGTNLLALRSGAREASQLGYIPIILTSHLKGEARETARVLAAIAKDAIASSLPYAPPACILAGGETTVTVHGRGKGGRNQEMAVSFLREIEKEPSLLSKTWFLSFSTDGEDGPTDAAGGFASASLVDTALSVDADIQDALHRNDSYALLKKIDGLFFTGQTNTNVCDISIIMVGQK